MTKIKPMPCSVTDSPLADYSDYIEKKGGYSGDDDFLYPKLLAPIVKKKKKKGI